MAKMLLAMDGINPNPVDPEFGRTPLLWAAIDGHKEIVKMLLAVDGIDLNPVDPEYGQTPLLWAATNEHQEIVELLPTYERWCQP
jgi:ankyrin repeat protein